MKIILDKPNSMGCIAINKTEEITMERQITWTTRDGKAVEVVVALVTEREVDADGHRVTVPCCEINVKALVGGITVGYGRPERASHSVAVAKIGKLGLTADNLAAMNAAIGEIEDGPDWTAKIEREARADESRREYDKHRAMMKKVMGY